MFKPTETQSLAKARLHKAVEARKGTLTLESLSVEQLCKLCGTRKVKDWLADPEFVAWLYDTDTFAAEVLALRDTMLARLREVATLPLGDPREGCATPKDVLAAADMLAKLSGSYPSRAKVVFADRDLNDMSDEEVAAKTAEARARLEREN